MNTAANVARAARHLIATHGKRAKTAAVARARNAEDSKRPAAARTWRNIAKVVRQMQRHRDR